MKDLAIPIIAAIAGVVAYKWWKRQTHSPWANNAQNAPTGNYGFTAMATGGGDLYPTPGMQSGIPVFNTTPASNKPDQLVAYLPNNSLATIPQTTVQYQPAFGFNENRTGGVEIF